MDIYKKYLTQYNKCWQQRIVKTSFVTAAVVLIFEIAYYFLLTSVGLRDQSSVEYILRYIVLPASISFLFCILGWYIVYRSRRSCEIKSLAAMLTMVTLCTTAASVHNIFATTLCSFFVPLAISVVFGKIRITNIVGCCCVAGELIAMYFASFDIRGNDPYFPLDCLMLFIVFGISWAATLLLIKNEQEKRLAIKHTWQLHSEVTARKKEQEELRLRLEQHQIILDQTTDIIFEWDIRKDTLSFSSNWFKKFGYDPICDKISERIPFSKNIHPDDMSAFVKIMKDTADGKAYSESEFRINDKNGQYRWCRIRATAQFDDNNHPIKAIGVILDISTEKREKQDLLKLAQRDALTGIYNKTATNALVAHRMNEFDSSVLQALLIIDIDFFKNVNDTYGHLVGDSIISQVATQLKEITRSNDVVGRIGGDEFLIYLPVVKSEGSALRKAQSIHDALGKLTPQANAVPITCSIGLAVFPHDSVKYSDLFRFADSALYLQKDKGRNGVSLYDKNSLD